MTAVPWATNWVREYNDGIISGQFVVSARVKRVYARLVDEMDNPKGRWVFDEALGERPIRFIEEFCKHSKGEWIGQPVRLELFQKAFIQALFGFVDKDTRMRRYNESMLLMGRKNGKTVLASGVSLYMEIGDGEGGAEVYFVATKKDQARIGFTESVNMVRQSPDLNRHIKKRKTDLYFPLTFSKCEALASDSNSMDGLNTHMCVIDELHAIKDRNLYEVMKQSMSARRQPLLFIITTSGTVRESIYDDMYEYACRVADGDVEDDHFLPILYELDDRSEWTDWRCWPKANPGLGSIKKLEDLTSKVERAKVKPTDLPGVLCKDFNVRSMVVGAWMSYEDINNQADYDIESLRDSYAIGGADLSSTTDLSCATLLIMKPGDETRYVLQQYFLPAGVLDIRVKDDKIPYDIWAERGLLTLCEGAKVQYADVTAWFYRMYTEYEIRPLWAYYDPWNTQYWVDEMRDHGFTMCECRQGYRTLSRPMKELEADLRGKLINYNNNPILKWCLTNTSAKRDENDNIRPVKGQHQRARIDGMVALLITYVGLFEHWADFKAMIG